MPDCDRAYENHVAAELEGTAVYPNDDEFWAFVPGEED